MKPWDVFPGSLSNLSISLLLSLLKLLQPSNTSASICLKRQKWTFSNNTGIDNIRLSSSGHQQPSSAHNPSGTPNLYQLLWTRSFWKHQLCHVNLLLRSLALQCSCYRCGWSGAFKVGLRWCNLHLTKKIKCVKVRLLQSSGLLRLLQDSAANYCKATGL